HSVHVGWARDPEVRTAIAIRLTGPKLDASGQIPEQARDTTSVAERRCVEADLGMVILSTEPQQVRLEVSRSGLWDYLEILP
ncbi:MAG TPA: hypothetical protein VF294_13305, partial [Polyangiaceae bacterium]